MWLFRVYIDNTQHDDIDWTPYTTHRDTVAFDPISYYSGWLACRSNLICRYMPEGCMCPFVYVQIIPRSPFDFAPNSIMRRHIDDILTDYKSHLVPEEYRSMTATSQCSYVDNYMICFSIASRPIMTLDTPRRPPRPAREDILENE
ncbi:uncharacterized protein LOC131650430 [Vicia villosa]|uniref:uncharacterized protein LOC131650430 n=1 Tax=Vicia villosa TaxID=3911 RepID=UPI00273C4073|nr:uncharacterized protein LOC131650430 [Vicia villosa]